MKKKLPTKAKLITFGGFSKIEPLKQLVRFIHYPLVTRVRMTGFEFTEDDIMTHDIVFEYYRTHKGYAEYNQINFIRTDTKKK